MGVLDTLTPEQLRCCNTEDEYTQVLDLLPPVEAALFDWAINLMADVVQHESYNKMNARNIAMVFAPNMTQVFLPPSVFQHPSCLYERDKNQSFSYVSMYGHVNPSNEKNMCKVVTQGIPR